MRKRRNNRKRVMRNRAIALLVLVLVIIGIVRIINGNTKQSANNSEMQVSQAQNVENNIETEVNNIENTEISNIIENSEEEEITDTEQEQDTEVPNKETVATNTNTTSTLKNGLPVLMYHFFYDENETTGPDNNWMEISDFEEQMKYLSDNNFYFPTWQEVENYIDGEINLPEKSIVITVDDGDDSFFELAIPVIQKYNAKATTFVITSWYGYRARDKQENISYQSHSDCMHEGASNGKGVMLSWSYDQILADVKNSSNILGGATVFCYPFGQYNDLDKKVLKDAGYKLAFTTEGGRVYKGNDKYALPRVRMSKGVSLSSFASMVN